MKDQALIHEINKLRADVRTALADYIASEGCSCCQDKEEHQRAAESLAKLLKVPKYKDGSGYDFTKFKSKQS